jgi:hypothetical protein
VELSTPSAVIARAERDGTRAETRFRLSPKWTSPFKSVGASVQSTAGSRGVRISWSNAGYTTFGGGARVLATHSIRQFPLHFPSRASPCATMFGMSYTTKLTQLNDTRNIEPIPLVIHQLIAKPFAYCPSLRNPLVQQIGNYTPADLTPVYTKRKRKRTKHILL